MKKSNLFLLIILTFISVIFVRCEELFGEEEESVVDTVNCSGYNGPNNIDPQYDYQCQAAYIYKCNGNTDALRKQCAFYKQLQQQLDLPDCDYCD